MLLVASLAMNVRLPLCDYAPTIPTLWYRRLILIVSAVLLKRVQSLYDVKIALQISFNRLFCPLTDKHSSQYNFGLENV